MGKQETKCPICCVVVQTAKGEAPPTICAVCDANILHPGEETVKWLCGVVRGAGGVKADVVRIILTNERILFRGERVHGASGGLLGGVAGAVLEDAVVALRSRKSANFVSLLLSDVESISEKPAGFLKRKLEVTLHAKDGSTYAMILSKKEREAFKAEIAPLIAVPL